jgi:hypothetical protein
MTESTPPEPGRSSSFHGERSPGQHVATATGRWLWSATSIIGMLVFEMFHSPPCALDHLSCGGSEFAAQIALNLIWGVTLGASVGIALAAIMLLLVDALHTRRSKGSLRPLVRVGLAAAGIVIVFVLVLVRFRFVRL